MSRMNHRSPGTFGAGLTPPPRVQLIDMSSVDLESAPIEQLVSNPFGIAAGNLVTVYGNPGSLKTYLVLFAAVQAALRGHGVLWLAGEGNSHALKVRIEGIARGLGSSRSAMRGNLGVVHGAVDLLGPTADGFFQTLTERFAPALVVVDPMAAYFWGDENSASDVKPFINQLTAWTEFGACVVLIHHARKANEQRSSDLRGSSALRAAMDSVFAVERPDPQASVCRVLHSKARDESPQRPRRVEFSFRDGAVEIDSQFEARAATAPKASNRDSIIELLRQRPHTKTELRQALNRSGGALNDVLGELISESLIELRGAGTAAQYTILK